MEDSACGSFQLMVSAYQPSLWLAKLAPVDPLSTAQRPMGRSVEPAVKRHAQCLDSHRSANAGISPRFLTGELAFQRIRAPCWSTNFGVG